MMQLLKNNIIFLTSFLFCVATSAQKFSVKAKLDTVPKAGFYSIDITPQLGSHVAKDFRDLRIADDQGKFVPYILRTTQPVFATQDYTRLPVIKNELEDSGRSVLVIQNNSAQKISGIALRLRNAAVTRTAAISGSDDMHSWFTIYEDINFQKEFVTDSDKYVQTIHFPASSYRYLKIVVDNGKNNPLNIVEAGMYTEVEHNTNLPYTTNPLPVIHQTDSSDNITYLNVRQPAFYQFDRIGLLIKGPHFYERNMDIITSEGISSFELSSDKKPVFDLQDCNDSSFSIKIFNGDNSALLVDSVLTEQENRQIVTYLEAGKGYYLLMHDSSAVKPLYDLRQFKDSIPYNIPELHIISFEKLNATRQNAEGISTKWIWPAIIVMLIVLGFFTARLIKEVNNRKA
jgi:hypothetical protein